MFHGGGGKFEDNSTKREIGLNIIRNGASRLGFERTLTPPAWRSEAGLAMPLPGLLAPPAVCVFKLCIVSQFWTMTYQLLRSNGT